MAGYLDRNIANLEAALKYSDLTPEQRAQAEKDLQEARANKGGWEDKALGGDPVPKPKEDPVEEMGVRGLGSLGREIGAAGGWGNDMDDATRLRYQQFFNPEMRPNMPHTNMPLSTSDRANYMAELLSNDPALSLYDFSTVKDFTDQPSSYKRRRDEQQSAIGYREPDTGLSYVEDLNRLGTREGPFKGSRADKNLASTTGHELTHGLLSKYNIDMKNIEEPRELPSTLMGEEGYLRDETYMPYEKKELLNRLLDQQKYGQTAGGTDWYLEKSPYAISKHPSGAEGQEAGAILKKSLEPYAEEFYKRVEQEKNPLIYDEETGYDARDLQNRGLAGIYPHAWDYGNQWQTAEEDEDDTQSGWNLGKYIPQGLRAYVGNKLGVGFGLPGMLFSGLTGGMGNLANTMRGGLTQRGYEQARNQRRTASRVENMLTRKAAGDPYSQKNLNVLTMGSRPGHYDVPGGNGGGGGAQPGSMPTGTAGQNPWGRARGGLAGLWQR